MAELPTGPERIVDTDRPARAVAAAEFGMLRGVATVVVVAIVAAAFWWWTGRPTAPTQPLERSGVLTSAAPSTAANTLVSPEPSGQAVLVDVRGVVRQPGVQQLPAGSRVLDAISAAGGLRVGRNYGAINLARIVADGEQIVVGKSSDLPASLPGAGSPALSLAPGAAAAIVDLNTATVEQLETLNGIGPVTAAEILAWRAANGRFTSVDDLLDVSGIGDKTLAGFRDQIRVG